MSLRNRGYKGKRARRKDSIIKTLQKQKLLSCAILAGILATGFVFLKHVDPKITSPAAKFDGHSGSTAVATSTVPTPFKGIHLEARSAIVWDIRNHKVLYARNANEVLPLASITKVVTAMTATDHASPNSIVTVGSAALASDGDNGLYAGESWKLKDLLNFSLVMSSNDGASAIAAAVGNSSGSGTGGESAFVQKMNEKVRSLGLTDMKFINPTGLDEGTYSGGMGSAQDVAKLMEYAITKYPSVFEVTRDSTLQVSSLNNITHTAINTDLDIDKIPNLLASKTGYTDNAGGNLAIVFDADLNRPLAIVVLGSTYDGRFDDVYKLVQASEDYIANVDTPPSLASTGK